MAFRTWATLLGTTLGAAALAAAGQLGVAYGLGILRFTRVVEVTARDEWTAQLAWVAWFAMTAAAAGAVVGHTRLPRTAGAGTRIVAAVMAGLGAAVVVPLTMQPARTARIAGVDAVFVIGACAVIGAVIGVFAAYAALSRAVARWSLLTLSGAVWAVALASVAPSLRPGQPLPAVRLGVFEAPLLPADVVERTALFTMPVLALVCGLLLGLAARRRRLATGSIALAGLPGAALLTIAYLVAGAGAGADRYQEVPYWAAMTAAGAGVFGSVLAAVLGRGTAKTSAAEPTPDRPPLPRRDAQPDSAIAQAGPPPAPTRPQPSPAHPHPAIGTAPPATGNAPALPPTGGALPGALSTGPLPGTGAAAAITGRAAVAARARVAAQRPEDELRPSDTGVLPLPQDPPFDGFTPQQSRGRTQDRPADGEFVDWVSGLGR